LAVGLIMASTAAATSQSATLRLIDRDPLAFQGRGFKAKERVRLMVLAPAPARKVTRASANGSFQVVFLSVAITRCDVVRAVAIGDEKRVVVKLLPSPACLPLRSPPADLGS
jgi:hypothetical protein